MQHNFRELKIWKDALKVVKSTYELCKILPVDERFGLTSQMQRCAVSIPSNIAEGSGRNSEKDFLRFINIAISSSYELETQLILAEELFDISIEQQLDDIHTLQKMISEFKKTLA